MKSIELGDNEIIKRDPILRLLRQKWNWSGARILVTASLVSAFIFLVFGGIANSSFHPGHAADSIAADYGLIALWTLIFSPVLWGFYLWQGHTLSRIFPLLAEKGVFGKADSESKRHNAEKVNAVFLSATHPMIFVLGLLFVSGYWAMRIYSPHDQIMAQGKYWFDVKWYLPLYILGWSIALYVMYVAILRQIAFLAGLSMLFRTAEIQVNPLDSDEVGGLAPVSQLISGTLFFLISFGLLISIYILVSYYRGIDIFSRLDMLGSLGVYMVLAPFCLIVPTVSVRNSMLAARSKVLAPIAEEFRRIIEGGNVSDKDFKEQNARLKELQDRYNTIVATYPVVPLSKSLLRILSLAASIPYLSGIVPIALEWLTNS